MDIDGNGLSIIELASSNVWFDVDSDGVLDKVAWVGPDDAIIVVDRNGDGVVSDFSELTFLFDAHGAGSDLEGLIGLDADHDGFITPVDVVYQSLLVWVYANSNGVSEVGELQTFADFGLASINLDAFNRTPIDQTLARTQVLGLAHVQLSNGNQMLAYNLALNYQPSDTVACGCDHNVL